MTAKPFSAEVLLLGWGTSPASGHWIKVQLDPALDGEAHPFRLFKSGAANGQRFRMDFAAIGDDETVAARPAGSSAGGSRDPAAGAAHREGAGATRSLDPPAAEPKPTPAERYAGKTEGQKAVVRASLLCEDAAFQAWIRERYPDTYAESKPLGEAAAASTCLRVRCGVTSRSALALGGAPLTRFLEMETAFKASRDYSPHLTGRK